jgi:2-oxoisovalerate dehydrogenase E1 component alpha subunit
MQMRKLADNRITTQITKRLYSVFHHYSDVIPAINSLDESFDAPPFPKRPVYQAMATSGLCAQKNLLAENQLATLKRILKCMIRLRSLDETFKAAQRQGKISFYLDSRGEEAAVIASAAALEAEDDIFSQYREHGALLWRGASFEMLAHQCCGTKDDLGKGRQMPVHYGDRARKFHTISSPLATQLLHGVGFAYAKRLAATCGKSDSLVACYFGDGCSSEGDFHSALNFASTLTCPVLFICRNNGYAISTPSREQYKGDGIVCRAQGYGMASCRVDGGDAQAVYLATRKAREIVLKTGEPLLLELMTYRLGDHSTSDDQRNYIPDSLLLQGKKYGDPIERLGAFLCKGGTGENEGDGGFCLGHQELKEMREEALMEARLAIEIASQTPPPQGETMFDDVYKSSAGNYTLSKQRLEYRLTRDNNESSEMEQSG